MTEEKTDKVHDYHSKYGFGDTVYWCDSDLGTWKGEVYYVRFFGKGSPDYGVHHDTKQGPKITYISEESLFPTAREAKLHAGDMATKMLQAKMVKLAEFMKDLQQ